MAVQVADLNAKTEAKPRSKAQMKRGIFLIILFLFQWSLTAEAVYPDITWGRIFLLDGDGNFLTDAGSHSISKYSPGGKLLLKMGRRGEGPGDIKRLGWFAVSPIDCNIYVTEFFGGNKWISKFSPEGKYVGHWEFQLDWTKYNALSIIKFDKKGNAYLQTVKSFPKRYKDVTLSRIENRLLKFSPCGKQLKTIYTFKADFSADKKGKGDVTIPFHNYLYWTVSGDKIIVRENTADHIKIFDNNGNLEKKIILPFKMEKVTDKDLDTWETRMKSIKWIKQGIAEGWFDLKYWRKRLPFPEYKPVSGGQIFTDSQGNIYSQKYPGKSPGENTWAVINPKSGSINIKKLSSKLRVLYRWKKYFFLRKSIEDDERVVVKVDETKLFDR